jgi:hypothetical protein
MWDHPKNLRCPVFPFISSLPHNRVFCPLVGTDVGPTSCKRAWAGEVDGTLKSCLLADKVVDSKNNNDFKWCYFQTRRTVGKLHFSFQPMFFHNSKLKCKKENVFIWPDIVNTYVANKNTPVAEVTQCNLVTTACMSLVCCLYQNSAVSQISSIVSTDFGMNSTLCFCLLLIFLSLRTCGWLWVAFISFLIDYCAW